MVRGFLRIVLHPTKRFCLSHTREISFIHRRDRSIMYTVELIPEGGTGDAPVQLQNGENVIGRGPLMRIADKKISRNHAKIQVDSDSGKVSFVQHALGRSFVDGKPINASETVELRPGSVISLLQHDHTYRIRISQTLKRAPSSAASESEDNTAKKAKLESNTANAASTVEETPWKGLAFPFLATGMLQFELNRAIKVASKALSDFFQAHTDPRLRLVLVEEDNALRETLEKDLVITDKRLTISKDDITAINSGPVSCCAAAIEATWRLKPVGNTSSKRIYKAAGPAAFDKMVKDAQFNPAETGRAYCIEVPAGLSLRTEHHFTHVVLVVSPNMNPQRPDCLDNDYAKGEELLASAYKNMLEQYYAIVADSEGSQDTPKAPVPQETAGASPETSAFDVLIKASREGTSAHPTPQKQASTSTRTHGGSWMNALYDYVKHPERYPDAVVKADPDAVIVKDKFPKARDHFLVIPTRAVETIGQLTLADMPM
eukprot:Colp12_sorted_trinity150504_noHs@11132